MSSVGVPSLTDHLVQRSVDSSIIVFDSIAVLVWILCLLYHKHRRALYFCIIGYTVYYFVDAIVWMQFMNVRWIHSPYNPYLVQLWLQLGPGIIHPSFVILMFESTFGPERTSIKREFWVILFILVQFTPCLLQQSFKFGSVIEVGRSMQSQRWLFVLLAGIGYMVLIQQQVSRKNLWLIFMICFGVEGCFELSLFISDIRIASLKTMIVDSIIEFNVGAGLIFYIWKLMMSKDELELMKYQDGDDDQKFV